MKKWFTEKVLLKYWVENASKYKLKDGRKIKSAEYNIPFDRHPDIGKNVLDDGSIVPCEIEWVTTNYNKHKHDVNVLIESDGFLVVLEKDLESFPVEQVQIIKKDFFEWFKRDAVNMANETVQNYKTKSFKKNEPQIHIYYMRSKGTGKINRKYTFEHGVDGFPESTKKNTLETLKQVKKGDIFIVARNFKSSINVKGGRNPSDKHKGKFEEIYGLVVTKDYYFSKIPKIWIKDKIEYPHRYNFRKKALFEGKNIPCTIKDLGRDLHEVCRKMQITSEIKKLDHSMIVKLMSLCRE